MLKSVFENLINYSGQLKTLCLQNAWLNVAAKNEVEDTPGHTNCLRKASLCIALAVVSLQSDILQETNILQCLFHACINLLPD